MNFVFFLFFFFFNLAVQFSSVESRDQKLALAVVDNRA